MCAPCSELSAWFAFSYRSAPRRRCWTGSRPWRRSWTPGKACGSTSPRVPTRSSTSSWYIFLDIYDGSNSSHRCHMNMWCLLYWFRVHRPACRRPTATCWWSIERSWRGRSRRPRSSSRASRRSSIPSHSQVYSDFSSNIYAPGGSWCFRDEKILGLPHWEMSGLCDGMEPTFFLFGSMLSFPATATITFAPLFT